MKAKELNQQGGQDQIEESVFGGIVKTKDL